MALIGAQKKTTPVHGLKRLVFAIPGTFTRPTLSLKICNHQLNYLLPSGDCSMTDSTSSDKTLRSEVDEKLLTSVAAEPATANTKEI